jgi:hypothetical protein
MDISLGVDDLRAGIGVGYHYSRQAWVTSEYTV